MQLLAYDNGQEANEHVIIFATEDHLQKLADCDVWCMDGNYAMAPGLFMQLYVIQGKVSGNFIPLAYCLLERKTQTSYEIMLRELDRRGCEPSVIIIDFERSVGLAVHAVMGVEVRIQYCFYHLTQSTWRKIQNLGLTNLYQENEEFRLFCGQLDGLAFLPPEEAEPLVTYFDVTYVSGQLRQRRGPVGDDGVPPIRIRRSPPMFPPQNWNMHQVTLDGEQRTNNA